MSQHKVRVQSTPTIGILDAGGQYCHLIARKIRELGVFAEIHSCSTSARQLASYKGIVISGGPASVFGTNKPEIDRRIFDLNVPVLGICYGHQILAETFGGKVRQGQRGEYGIAQLSINRRDLLFKNLKKKEPVWMNHRDVVEAPPRGFDVIASTNNCAVAAMVDHKRRYFGLQFHPEVVHTTGGKMIFENFLQDVCACEPSWKPEDQINEYILDIKRRVGENKNVFFLVSGGVDSTVAFSLCVEALGKTRVRGLYVDTGFMRRYDHEAIQYLQSRFDNIKVIDASKEFIRLLRNVTDPEQKRKEIGRKFLEITEEALEWELHGNKEDWVIGQGTIYPDTIESGGSEYASRIKTHHNRVSLAEELIQQGRVIEPLRELYKDEVRTLGFKIAKNHNLPSSVILRQPFPGPGLAIRCLASADQNDLVAHPIVHSVAKEHGFSAATLPLRSVGVQGDERSYSYIVVLTSDSQSKATHSRSLEKVSTAITNSAVNVNRVTFCLTHEGPFSEGEWYVREALVTSKRVELLRDADALVNRFLIKHNLLTKIWQFPVVLIPFSRRGSSGDSIVLRPVDSIDGMTAQFSNLSLALLRDLTNQLLKLEGIDSVLFDVTNKPPATIEWE